MENFSQSSSRGIGRETNTSFTALGEKVEPVVNDEPQAVEILHSNLLIVLEYADNLAFLTQDP